MVTDEPQPVAVQIDGPTRLLRTPSPFQVRIRRGLSLHTSTSLGSLREEGLFAHAASGDFTRFGRN